MNFLKRAKELQEETIVNRRHLHKNPEIGYDLPKTTKFVKDKLNEYGYKTEELIENSVVAYVGNGNGKTILLRADMDALAIKEETGLEYASTNEYMHACGHDAHTAMLLTVAKILKENEKNIEGTIKLAFQPAEELLTGAKAMIDAGLLEDVDVAMAAHFTPPLQQGIIISEGISMSAANNFRITVKGTPSHGALPHNGVDPVFIGAHIIIGLQEIILREVSFDESATLTTGKFNSQGTANSIPDHVVIEGTMRTFSVETQEHLKKRVPEVAKAIANAFRGDIEFEFLSDVPPLYNDPEFTKEIKTYIETLLADEYKVYSIKRAAASEDFAFISQKVPSMYFRVGLSGPGEKMYPVHHPKMNINESMLPIGVAAFCESAVNWLKNNK